MTGNEIVTANDLDPATLQIIGNKVVAQDPTKAPATVSGISSGADLPVVDGDTVNTAVAKLQAQVNAGAAGDKNFVFTQSIASDTWTINHPLAKFPSVTVIDSAGTEVVGSVQFISISQIVLTFSAPFGGTAYLN